MVELMKQALMAPILFDSGVVKEAGNDNLVSHSSNRHSASICFDISGCSGTSSSAVFVPALSPGADFAVVRRSKPILVAKLQGSQNMGVLRGFYTFTQYPMYLN